MWEAGPNELGPAARANSSFPGTVGDSAKSISKGVTHMGYNPENLEAPNSSEKPPVRRPSDAVIKGLGQTAVKGS